MTDDNTRCGEMFLRVDQLGKDEAASYAANTFIADLFNSLSSIISGLETHTNAQASGLTNVRMGTRSKEGARVELERGLDAMRRTSRSMSVTMPGLEKKFPSVRHLKDQELLTAARMYAADALPLKAEFIKRGLQPTFLDDLNEDIEAFEEALRQRTQGRETHVNATATIDDLIEQGMKIVRQLDPIMRNLFEDNPGKLAAWLSASHVERAPRRKAKQQQTSPQTTATESK
ncbi:MAG: hypothetical protein DMF68_10495 [Acidobacteria bacterium]|nr:MAG: hypothetical protein DMF68_10495 [Acidobacteriota bacterium]